MHVSISCIGAEVYVVCVYSVRAVSHLMFLPLPPLLFQLLLLLQFLCDPCLSHRLTLRTLVCLWRTHQ